MVNVFFTGSTGYLGSTFLLHAPEHWNIFCFGRSRPQFPLPENAEWIYGDLRSGPSAITIPEETDTIIHLAGIKGSGACNTQPSTAIETNITGTHHLLQAAKNREVGKIIFASTYWVYGETGRMPFEEQMTVSPSEFTAYQGRIRTGNTIIRVGLPDPQVHECLWYGQWYPS